MYRNITIIAIGCLACLGIFFASFNGEARDRADFVWINGTEPETLDVCRMTGQPEGDIAICLFEGLTSYHPETLEPMPAVATHWTIKGLTYTFHLRPDSWWVKEGEILLADGKKRHVSAHDFVYSWRRHCLPEVGSQYGFLLDPILGITEYRSAIAKQWSDVGAEEKKQGRPYPRLTRELPPEQAERIESERVRLWNEMVGIKALDDLTLEVTLKAFTPYFIQLTSFYSLSAQPREAIEEHDEKWFLPENIVTNGPYQLADWRFNSYIRLTKNPHYWESKDFADRRRTEIANDPNPTPTMMQERQLIETLASFEEKGLTTLEALAIEKSDLGLNLYINGDVDKVRQIPSQVVGELLDYRDQHPKAEVASHLHNKANPAIYYYDLNMNLPIFAQGEHGRKLRQAMALAIDRRRLVLEVSRGRQEPARTLVADFVKGYNAEARFGTGDMTKDVETARKLLKEVTDAGVKIPTLRILYNTMEEHKAIAAFIQDQWKKNLGIDVKLENQEWQVYLNSRRSGQFDIARAAWIPDYSDPNTFLDMFTSDDFTKRGEQRPDRSQVKFGSQNHPHFNNPLYNRLVMKYSAELLDHLKTPEARQGMLDDIEGDPSFKDAVGSVRRKNGTTSFDDLKSAMDRYLAATNDDERFEASSQARLLLLEIAEQLLMYDLPIIPIYHYSMTQLWPGELEGIHMNERDSHPPKFLRWNDGVRPAGSRYQAFPYLPTTLKTRTTNGG